MDQNLLQLLEMLGSPDKAARQQAEAHYAQLRETSALQLLRGFLQVVQAGPGAAPPQAKSMACVLLRQLFDAKFKGHIRVATMDPALLNEVRQGLVAAVAGETQAEPRRKLAHALAQVAAALPEGAEWPELLQLAAQLMGAADSAAHREAGFELLDKVAEYRAALLLPFAAQLPAPLAAGLGDAGSPEVRLAALKAACSVVLELGRQGQGAEAAFRPLIFPMLRVLEAAVKDGDGQEEAAQEAIAALTEVTEEVPKFWGDAVGTAVGPVLAALIGAGEAMDPAVRVAAINWAATLAERAPARFRRGDWMAGALLPALLDLVCVPPPPLEGGGGEDAWAQRAESTESMGDLHDGEEEEEGLAEAAALAFDRLAKAVGAKAFYKAAAPRLLAAMQEQDPAHGWCRRRGALYALAMMAEGCEGALQADLPQLLPFLLRFHADPHPRVRYALLVCLTQLCEDLPEAPDGKPFQKMYAGQVLPVLASALGSEANRPYPRLLAAAASSVASFCQPERVSAKMVGAEPLEALLRALFHLLTAAPLFVREEAMTAVATLAQVVGEAFVPYYDTFVPLAKQALAEAMGSGQGADGVGGGGGGGGGELSMLGLKALEAFALMGDAVGRERFRADAHAVLQLVASLHEQKGSGLLSGAGPAAEAQAAYVMNSTARIGTALGKEFAPYLAQVLPMVLEAVARKPTYRVRTAEGGEEAAVVDSSGERVGTGGDEGEEEAREGDQLIGVEVRGGGRFEVMVNSWELQQREVACQSLMLYVEELGSCLAPYLPQVLQVVLDLVTPTSTPDARICAYHMLPKLLRCAARASSGMGAEMASEALNEGVRRLVAGLARESDMVDNGSEETLEVLCVGADTLSLGLEVADGSARRDDWVTLTLADALVAPAMELLQKLMVRTIRRRVALQQETEVLDEEDADLLERREEWEQELLNSCQEALGWLLRLKGAAALEPFHRLLFPLVGPLLAADSEGNALELRLIGLCIHLDVLEHGGPQAAALAPAILPHVKALLGADDEDCQQAGAYGVGVLAQHGGDALDAATVQQQLLPALLALIVPQPGGRAPPPEPGCVRDNAISSVLRLCRHRPQLLRGAEAAARLLHEGALTWLPLREDLGEAHSCHAHFVEWAASGDPGLFGAQGERLGSVVGALAALMVDQRPEEDRAADSRGAEDGDAEELEDEMWQEQFVTRQTRLDIERCMARIQASYPADALAAVWAGLDEERRRAVQTPTANVFRQQAQ